MITVYFDRLCEPRNPGGVGAYGFVVYKDGEVIHTGKAVVGEGEGVSNNVAEFSGLIAALEWLLENGYSDEKIVVRGDSQLAINLMNHVWRARGGMYYPYYLKALELAKNFHDIRFEWVPREQNEVADRLSREAYEEYCRARGRAGRQTSSSRQKASTETQETCMVCKWVRSVGPHVGCYYNGEYRKWLAKKFAKRNRCEHFEKL